MAYLTLIAGAENAKADALLTTDDQLVRLAGRGVGDVQIVVQNPLSWLEEHGE